MDILLALNSLLHEIAGPFIPIAIIPLLAVGKSVWFFVVFAVPGVIGWYCLRVRVTKKNDGGYEADAEDAVGGHPDEN